MTNERTECKATQRNPNTLRGNVERLWDLVRFKRHDLFDADIISAQEFTALAQDHSTVERLETNDALRREREELRQEIAELQRQLRLSGENAREIAEREYALRVELDRVRNHRGIPERKE